MPHFRIRVTRPLAIVFFEKLLPGSRLSGRLSDLGWRVLEAKKAGDLPGLVRSERPLVVVAELALRSGDLCPIVTEVRRDPETRHVPILGYCPSDAEELTAAARQAGVDLVAAESGVLDQLPQLLDHVLAVE